MQTEGAGVLSPLIKTYVSDERVPKVLLVNNQNLGAPGPSHLGTWESRISWRASVSRCGCPRSLAFGDRGITNLMARKRRMPGRPVPHRSYFQLPDKSPCARRTGAPGPSHLGTWESRISWRASAVRLDGQSPHRSHFQLPDKSLCERIASGWPHRRCRASAVCLDGQSPNPATFSSLIKACASE